MELERAFAEMGEPEKKALNCCKAIQVLLPSQKKIINKFCSGPDCEIIPNIVPENQRVSDGNHKKLLFVGRLTKAAKRPHLAIQAFEKVASKFPEWKLEMWGDSHGSERYLKEMKMISFLTIWRTELSIEALLRTYNQFMRNQQFWFVPVSMKAGA